MRTHRRRAAVLSALALAVAPGLGGCVKPVPPAPAEVRTSAPPWSAPRDAVSYIDAAGLAQLPLDESGSQRLVRLRVVVDGADVAVPAYVGVDRLRAVQAAAHTHDGSGSVYLEGEGDAEVTLGQFFTLWGVRLDERCLGGVCGRLSVTTERGPAAGDPRALRLVGAREVTVAVSSR